MKINLLLSLGLVLVSATHVHHAASDKNLIVFHQLSGKWSSIYLASSVQKRIEDGGDKKFSIKIIAVREHDVLFDLYLLKDGKCIQHLLVANKTEKNNVLKLDYEGENTIYVEKADAQKYVIFSMHNIQNGVETVVLELYGQTKVMKESVKKFFKNLCQKNRINKDDIIDVAKHSSAL
ncbi:major urinary protein-like [Vombatus ursinus]|uniref:major urinary protein-like n=1 Tax=Vombatus ursinus TaxID=29139 RepID=UPI000FFD634C|nr:major urinary protein-like [Vombatus ursinus]